MPVLTRSKTAAARNAASPAATTSNNDQVQPGATASSSSSQQQQHQMAQQTPSTSTSGPLPSPPPPPPPPPQTATARRGRGKGGSGRKAAASRKVTVAKKKVQNAPVASNAVGPNNGTSSGRSNPGSSAGPVGSSSTTTVGSSSATGSSSIPSRKSIDRAQAAAMSGTPATDEDSTPTTNIPNSVVVAEEDPTKLNELPPDWLRLCKETSESLQLVKTFPLDGDSMEFKSIADLVAPLEVTYAVKIVNPDLWARYNGAKNELLKTKSEDLGILAKLGLTDEEFMRQAHSSLNFQRNPLLTPYSINEVLLLHCTNTLQNVYSIYDQGLDERLGGATGTRLGRGIYFASNPLKAINYDGTGNTMMIFSVLLGDCLAVTEDPTSFSLVREPRKQPEQRRRYNDMAFESITGVPASGGGYNEFVIFNRYLCYPLYALLYSKPAAVATAPTGGDPMMPPVAWRIPPGGKIHMPNQNPDGNWASLTANIFAKMHSAGPAPPSKEDCEICTEEFDAVSVSPALWREPRCGHKLCLKCYNKIEVNGITMSGSTHTSFKCPFCQEVTGIAIGVCPTGSMTVKVIPESCEGYPGYGSIQIHYLVSSGPHDLNRIAYLPNNPEGKDVLNLLEVAWDRRLTFTIGNSVTTGAQNVLIWNVHHKTAIGGGVDSYGYPDPGYMERVKWELTAFGIGSPDGNNN